MSSFSLHLFFSIIFLIYSGAFKELRSSINTMAFDNTPEMYGAKGNGIDDDSKFIQAAIDNSKGQPVYFSSKTYIVKETITLPPNTIIRGNSTKIFNKNKKLRAVFSANNADNIVIDGFEIDFGAIKTNESLGMMLSDGVITLSGEKGCNNSHIRNCKIYNLNYLQSGIVVKGDNVEVSYCEVFSGAGNRMNCGIVCGSYDYSSPSSKRNGGCNNASVYNCYVHDISVGSQPSESGYGIYLLSCNYSAVSNCRVENCNWVCINSQSEKNLPSGGHNYIINNYTKLDSKLVCPRKDYLGPYNIYFESSPYSNIIGNILVCGEVSSNRYIPLQIGWGSDNVKVRNNKFKKSNTQNTYALVGIDDRTFYENNECDFSPSTYFFCYNSDNPYLYVSNCSITAKERIINYRRNNKNNYKGMLSIHDCELTAPRFKEDSYGDEILLDFKNSKFNDMDMSLTKF